MTDNANRRGFIRIPFQTVIEIKSREFSVKLDTGLNLSMGGIHVPFVGDAPPRGAAARVSIILGNTDYPVSIEASGTIIRSEPGSLAIEFIELDADSYAHLRELILNNAEDPERAEREFDAHWGIKPRAEKSII